MLHDLSLVAVQRKDVATVPMAYIQHGADRWPPMDRYISAAFSPFTPRLYYMYALDSLSQVSVVSVIKPHCFGEAD